MNKTPAAMAGVSVHGSERDTPTAPRIILQARPGMAARLELLRSGLWWAPRFKPPRPAVVWPPANDAGAAHG